LRGGNGKPSPCDTLPIFFSPFVTKPSGTLEGMNAKPTSPPETIPVKLVGPDAIAAVYSVDAKAVLNAARDGIIPCHRIGRTVRFSLPDVLAATRVHREGEGEGGDE